MNVNRQDIMPCSGGGHIVLSSVIHLCVHPSVCPCVHPSVILYGTVRVSATPTVFKVMV